MFRGDRWLRPRGDVGRYRLSPLSNAWLDCMQLGYPRPALHSPASDGVQPSWHSDRANEARLRSVLYGNVTCIHDSHRFVSVVASAPHHRRVAHVVGILLQHVEQAAAIQRFRLSSISPSLPMAMYPARQGGSNTTAAPSRH